MRRKLAFAAIALCIAFHVSAADAPATKLPLGTRRPKLDFRLLDGSRPPSWPRMRGQVVVLDFWATWCAPCVASIPHLDALKQELAGERVLFYSITYEPKAKAVAFLEKHPMTTTVGLDQELATFKSLIAWGIPMTYVFDREGKVVAVVNPTRLTAAMIRNVLTGRPIEVEQHPGWRDPVGAAKYFYDQLIEDRKKYE